MSLFKTKAGKIPELDQYQVELVKKIYGEFFRGVWPIIAQLPTGGGKTIVAAKIILDAIERGVKILFIVNRIELIHQTIVALNKFGLDSIGVIQADHPRTDPDQPIQIASVQTLQNRKLPSDIGLIIVDECHEVFATTVKILKENPHVKSIGLSATPGTKGLGKIYKKIISSATLGNLIDNGRLSKFTVFSHGHTIDLTGVKTKLGEFDEKDLADRIDKAELVGDIYRTWRKHAIVGGNALPTLVFGLNRQHAQNIQQIFVENDVRAEYLDCFTKPLERGKIIDQFRNGKIDVIVNVGILAVGFDSDCRVIVDARPTKSKMRYMQVIGRGLRSAPGKERLIYLDHAGNCMRHGLPIDVTFDELCTKDKGDRSAPKKKERAIPLPRVCPQCANVLPVKDLKCSECGHVRPVLTSVIVRDGTLVEYGQTKSNKSAFTDKDKVKFYAELMGYGINRGFARGWAAHNFKARFGHWPNGASYDDVKPKLPSGETIAYVKSALIRFSKGKKRRGGKG